MEQLTIKPDYFIKELIRRKQLVWVVTLNNGQEVYSDFERENLEHPWERLRKHLGDSGLYATKVRVMGLGAPVHVLHENPDGIDGFFILRSVVKDVSLEAGEDPLQFQSIIFGVWDDQDKIVKVKMFYWPEQDMWPTEEVRSLTTENLSYMIFKTQELKEKLNGIAKVV
jgi:hypothetical protein